MERKIKKRTEIQSLVGSDDQVKRKYKRGYQEYDQRGNLIRDVNFQSNGEIESAVGYKYDEQNRLIEEIHYYEGGDTGENIKFKLDSQGNRTEIETTYADGSSSLRKIARFENMVSVKSYDEDGDFESEELIKYNDAGKVIEETHYDEDRKVVQQELYEYDENLRLSAKTEYGEKEEFIVRVEVEYNEKDEIIREVHLNRKNEVMRQVSIDYDENGNQVALGNGQHETRTTYDDKGNPVKEEVVNSINGMIENYKEYIYSEQGLLVEELTFAVGEQYELEPGVTARTKSSRLITSYEYELFEE